MRNDIDKSQTGFIPLLGTEINLSRLAIAWTRNLKKAKDFKFSGILFIDLKAAFDTVPHNTLLDILRRSTNLNETELETITFLIKNSYLYLN